MDAQAEEFDYPAWWRSLWTALAQDTAEAELRAAEAKAALDAHLLSLASPSTATH